MDEVITCQCGGQYWVLGTSGTRCSQCCGWLAKEAVRYDVRTVNEQIKAKMGEPMKNIVEKDMTGGPNVAPYARLQWYLHSYTDVDDVYIVYPVSSFLHHDLSKLVEAAEQVLRNPQSGIKTVRLTQDRTPSQNPRWLEED